MSQSGWKIKVNLSSLSRVSKRIANPKPHQSQREKRKPPYRKEKWKAYERVSVLQGSSLDFVSTTETPDNEKEARRLVRSGVMKDYHTKRRQALKETQQFYC